MLIQEYQDSWREDFNKIRTVIETVLTGLDISIEHIGSTSIPGLAAKPIIDLDIVFGSSVGFDEIKIRLEETGYFHYGDQGIAGREVFKRNKTASVHNILDLIAHHLYVCPADSEELHRHIMFRDLLIANKELRIQYQDLKCRIAEKADQDRKKYAQLKEVKAKRFINDILGEGKDRELPRS